MKIRAYYRSAMKALPLAPLLLSSAIAQASIAYVSNEKDNSLSLIDLQSLEVVDTIDVGQRPRGITFSKDYSKLYICASDDDTVQIMDTATHQIIGELPSGEDPEQFSLHPDNRRLYISNEDDALVTVVDAQDATVLAQIDVGVEPEGWRSARAAIWRSTPPKPPACCTGSTPPATS